MIRLLAIFCLKTRMFWACAIRQDQAIEKAMSTGKVALDINGLAQLNIPIAFAKKKQPIIIILLLRIGLRLCTS